MFKRHHESKFQHTFIYVDEHKEKIDGIRERAAEEIGMIRGEYNASKLKGFLTNRTYRNRISTTAAVITIIACAAIWYLLIY